MTPTQPAPLDDAGAMAVLRRFLALPTNIPTKSCLDAVAHLAARLSGADATVTELREELASLRVYVAANVERASRAEAELAAVRANAERYVWLRDDADSGTIGAPYVAIRKIIDGRVVHLSMSGPTEDRLDAAVDAARGAG